MMLRILDRPEKVDVLRFPHRGVVLSNDDPKKQGRIKVQIPGVFEGATDRLPWCFCFQTAGLSGATSTGSFAVPEIGSEVMVYFPYGDVYAPAYFAVAQSSKTHVTHFDEDYPESYGFVDSTGTKVRVNKDSGLVDVVHGPSGAKFSITKEGDIAVETDGDVNIQAAGRITVTPNDGILITVGGNVISFDEGGVSMVLSGQLTVLGGVMINGLMVVNGAIILNGRTLE